MKNLPNVQNIYVAQFTITQHFAYHTYRIAVGEQKCQKIKNIIFGTFKKIYLKISDFKKYLFQ